MPLYSPLRRSLWAPTILPPGPAQHWRPNWGNPYLPKLAFLFLPTPDGYWDVVRGDRMTLSGATTSTVTPFGRTWLMGASAGSVAGYATTAGGNNYYQPPTVGSTVINMTIMCGTYNPATTGTPADAFQAAWSDSSGGFAGNGITVEVRQFAGVPRMCGNVVVASSNTQEIASGGAGVTMATNGQGITMACTYDKATVFAGYSSTALGFGSASGAKTTIPTGIDRVFASNPGTTLSSNRCVLWVAGWFRTLSLTEVQTLVATNGGLPSGFLRRK